MLAGRINPGQLRIVREILQSATKATETDQAIYSDLRANYDITRNADNTWTVAHTRGTATDGIDTVRNIEELVFTDDIMNLTGEPRIDDMTPTERHVLTANPGTVAAFSNVPESAISFQWQVLVGGAFVNIAGATGASFTPQQAQVGQQLRVMANFVDATGVSRAIPSAATAGGRPGHRHREQRNAERHGLRRRTDRPGRQRHPQRRAGRRRDGWRQRQRHLHGGQPRGRRHRGRGRWHRHHADHAGGAHAGRQPGKPHLCRYRRLRRYRQCAGQHHHRRQRQRHARRCRRQ
jgi:hypothetical protein